MKSLEGTWRVESAEHEGKQYPKETIEKLRLVIEGNSWLLSDGVVKIPRKFTIYPTKSPRALDLILQGEEAKVVHRCIYELKGDTLKLCRPFDGAADRPTKFESTEQLTLTVWKREKK